MLHLEILRQADELACAALKCPADEQEKFLHECEAAPEVRERAAKILHEAGQWNPSVNGEMIPVTRELQKDDHIRHYRIVRTIGRGGLGIVYEAIDEQHNRQVAVKSLRTDRQSNSESLLQEAKTLGGIEHDHVVRIFDSFQEESSTYVVMQYIDGETLSSTLKTKRPFGDKAAAEILGRVASAVQAVHSRAMLHRDLTTNNIILDTNGKPYILDFGLAEKQLTDAAQPDVAEPKSLGGTPRFVAPELSNGKAPTPQSDIYGLGAVLFAMVRGTPPPDDHQQQIDALNETDAPLRAICLKCLHPDPAARYLTSETVADDLRRYLEHQPTTALKLSRVGKLKLFAKRRPAVCILLGLLTAAIVSGVAGVLNYADLEHQQRLETEAQKHDNVVQSARNLAARGDWPNALKRYQEAIDDERSDRLRLEVERTRGYFVTGQHSRIRTELARLFARDDIGDLRGTVMLMQGDYLLTDESQWDEGKASIHQALETGSLGTADELYARAILADRAGSRKLLLATLDIEPFHHRANLGLALSMILGAEFDDAIQHLEFMTRSFPEDESAKFLLAWIAVWQGQLESGLSQLEELQGLSTGQLDNIKAFFEVHHTVMDSFAFPPQKEGFLSSVLGVQLDIFANVGDLVGLMKNLKSLEMRFEGRPTFGRFGLAIPLLPWVTDELKILRQSLTLTVVGKHDEAEAVLEGISNESRIGMAEYLLAHIRIKQAKAVVMQGKNQEFGKLLESDVAPTFHEAADKPHLAPRLRSESLLIAAAIDAFLLEVTTDPGDELRQKVLDNHLAIATTSQLSIPMYHQTADFVIRGLPNLEPRLLRPILIPWQYREPGDSRLWELTAILEIRDGNRFAALKAIESAQKLTVNPMNLFRLGQLETKANLLSQPTATDEATSTQ